LPQLGITGADVRVWTGTIVAIASVIQPVLTEEGA
jgi:hypothetical protein